MSHATIFVVANLQAGSGKSTTAAVIATELVSRGARVIAVDLDPQASLTRALGVAPSGAALEALEVVFKDPEDPPLLDLDGFLVPSTQPVPSEAPKGRALGPVLDVLAADRTLDQVETREKAAFAVAVFVSSIPSLAQHYDYVVVDTPPTNSPLTVGAILAADIILAPVAVSLATPGDPDGIIDLIEKVRAPDIREDIAWPPYFGTFATRVGKDRETAHHLVKRYGSVIPDWNDGTYWEDIEAGQPFLRPFAFNGYIREAGEVREAEAVGQPVTVYAPDSTAAQDYRALTAEILRTLFPNHWP